MPYSLVSRHPYSWPISFDRLCDAKAAADLPAEQLVELQRKAFAAFQYNMGRFLGKSEEAMIFDDAAKEDADRDLLAARLLATQLAA